MLTLLLPSDVGLLALVVFRHGFDLIVRDVARHEAITLHPDIVERNGDLLLAHAEEGRRGPKTTL